MNRFNLTFSGETLPGEDPAAVRKRFARLFAIDDPARLERFFSGETVTLRRNLDRKAAAECFQDMQRIGAVAQLVKTSAKEAADLLLGPAQSDAPAPEAADPAPGAKQTTKRRNRKKPAATPASAPSREPAITAKSEKRGRSAARKRKPANAATASTAGSPAAKASNRSSPEAKKRESPQDKPLTDESSTQAASARKAAQHAERAARQRARREAQAQARREAKEQAKCEAREQARRDAEAKAQREAQEKARRQAEEQAHRAAREQARRDAEAQAQREAQEKARREAEERAQLEAREQARREAEARSQKDAQRQDAERAAREQILHAARLEAQRPPQDEADAGATRSTSRSPGRGKVRTRLDIPLRDTAKGSARHRTPARKRQPGEPNVYALRPFRNALAVRERAPRALQRSRVALLLGTGALTLLIVLTALRHGISAPYQPPAAQAIASDSSGGLTILSDNALLRHDRSGTASNEVRAQALGLRQLAPPLLFTDTTTLLISGSTLSPSEPGGDNGDTLALLRCRLEGPRCEPLSPGVRMGPVNAVAFNPVDGSVFTASASTGLLTRWTPDGEARASAELRMPVSPVIRLHSGLLLMNSPSAPAISVYRYDDAAFGSQLDEVLLLPTGLDPQTLRVGDFVRNAGSWWVVLYDTTTNGAGVYRFGDEWQYLGQAEMEEARWPLQLTAWGEKLLVNDGRGAGVARFNSEGAAEVPFVSSLLQHNIAQGERANRLSALGWRAGLTLCALLVVFGLTIAYLERLRERVYRVSRARGAEPVDEHIDALDWVAPASGREKVLRSRAVSLAVLTLAAALMAVGQGASAWQLATLLTALAGPAIGLAMISRQPIGHIGTLEKQLLLVDHDGLYHLGADSRIQYRGAFLLMDDVIVFRGNALLPAFSQPELAAHVTPLLRGGVKVDRTTTLIKLLQARHPLAVAAGVCALTSAASLLMLALASSV
ncbi:MAG: hypothetical protein R3E54_04060 [Halioglobus sp.]